MYDMSAITLGNDRIRSVKVPPAWTVILYEEVRAPAPSFDDGARRRAPVPSDEPLLRPAPSMSKRDNPRGSPALDQELNPYRVAAADRAALRRSDAVRSGAVMVLVALIVVPVATAVVRMAALPLHDRGSGADELLAVLANVLALLDGAALVAGAYRLTEDGPGGPTPKALKATTRLTTLAYSAVLAINLVLSWSDDASGFTFFRPLHDISRTAALAALALVAARHLSRAGAIRSARLAKMLVFALPAVAVASSHLMRITYDDAGKLQPSPHAYWVLPLHTVMWVMHIVVFGMLYRTASKRAAESPG
ncbi:Hypothetical protein A7982_02367 [Minicystis rosea]|nr:Hypothetical protein A7982_02367 [Minicystis rosea]